MRISVEDAAVQLAATAADTDANGELSPRDIGIALGLTSPNSRNRWITRAVEANLIVATTENAFDPHRAYTLTRAGREQHAAHLRKSSAPVGYGYLSRRPPPGRRGHQCRRGLESLDLEKVLETARSILRASSVGCRYNEPNLSCYDSASPR